MKTVVLKDGTTVSLKLLTCGDVRNLCRMLWSLTDDTRALYHGFVVTDRGTFLKTRVELLLRLLFNPIEYRLRGMYFLGVTASNVRRDVVGFVYVHIKSYDFFSSASYGIVIRDDYQGKGLGDILTRCILAYGKRLGVNKITLTVRATNQKALSLFKRHGFEIEGLHKKDDLWKDEVFDVYHLALHLDRFK